MNKQVVKHYVSPKFVWEYFEDIGFSDYLAIDINTELRSIAMDLNFILKDKYNYTTQFDYVTNNGTGEHIFPINAQYLKTCTTYVKLAAQ